MIRFLIFLTTCITLFLTSAFAYGTPFAEPGRGPLVDHEALSRLYEKLFHSGQKEVMAYDTRNRVLSVDLKDGSTFLRTQDYTYNAGSQITQSVVTDGTSTLEDVAYLYDDGGALISEDHTGGPKIDYDYDLSGNRTEKKTTVGFSTTTLNYVYSTDNEDRLLSINDGVNTLRTFDYDNARRRISEVNGGGTTTYSYDHAARLTGITYPNSTTDSFGYNGLDTRLSKTEISTTTTYNRAGAYVTDPVLSDTNASYTPGISERRSSATTYLHSGLKNVGAQSNTSKVVTASKEFDAFGEELGATGTWKGQSGYGGGFGYQSAERSGLMLLGHRYYDPSTGSFLTSDPAKSGDNWFAYCGNNPLTFADPSGLSAIGDFFLTIWQLPQELFGAIGSIGGDPVLYHEKSDTVVIENSWLSNITGCYITLGRYVLAPRVANERILAHEYAHRQQSAILGPLYLLSTGAGYSIGAARTLVHKVGDAHDNSPLEMDADARSGEYENISDNKLLEKFWINK